VTLWGQTSYNVLVKVWWENLMEKTHLENRGVNGSFRLICMLQ